MRRLFLLALSAGLSFAQLQGIVDIHVHSDPDRLPRSRDGVDTAREAKDAGMRALVLKNHWEPTVQLAYTVAKVVPGIEIFGGIALNRSVGGVNPEAVLQAAAVTGRKLKIVWMPTADSENNVAFSHSNAPFVSVAKDGKLLPEVVEVIKILAREKLVLATGHSSAAEDLLLVREGRKQGVAQMVVTHPLSPVIHMTTAQMKEAASLGAYIELCGANVLPSQPANGALKVEDYVAAIRQVGTEHIILSGDLGNAVYPPHAEAWKQLLAILRKAGVTDSEIDQIARQNPATLLGL